LPKLALFVPCHTAIIDQDQNLSLIGIFQELKVAVGQNTDISQEAAAPFQWTVVCMWLRNPGEEGARFESTVELVMPDGSRASQSKASFALDKPSHRDITRFFGFPIAASGGEYNLRVLLRDLGHDGAPSEVATFPMRVHVERVVARQGT
jgi:hypothetical protein